MELSASMLWARVMLGMYSIAKLVTFRCVNSETTWGFASGARNPTYVVPGFRRAASLTPPLFPGGWTFATNAASPATAVASAAMRAPACV